MISPKRVKDLADTMGLSENKTSYHLNILKDAGFIYSSKSGRDTIYSLKDAFAFKNLLSAVMELCRID
jgi:predicted transcriptional regulator